MVEEQLADPDGVLVHPDSPSGVGVLVLAGSSGRIDAGRARLLAAHGATACSIRWFGGPGQPPGACEVPLETFTAALDRLAGSCERLAIVGLSFGAEAALLTAAVDDRVQAVIAFAPTSVVWANAGPGRDGLQTPPRSKWTLAGRPLPFVPYDQDWEPTDSPPSYRGLYLQSARTYRREAAAAAIAVEAIVGEVVCIAGEDDAVWPSADYAQAIAARRLHHGRATTVITHPRAGHRTTLPGETPPPPRDDLAHGGNPAANAELGAQAWPAIVRSLGLTRFQQPG